MSSDVSDETFRPHPLEWTDAQVQRFWDYYSSKPGRAEVYFAHKFGRSILRTVSRHADLSGVVVDLGCGPGYLVDLLLQEEVQVVAIDSSPASVAAVGAKFAQRSGFR